MDKEIDWNARWRAGRIGFHQDRVNALLIEHWPIIVPDKRSRVLVPLCGKSSDMVWLLKRGHTVVGAELSSIAVESFFTENRFPFSEQVQGDFRVFIGEGEADGLSIVVGDFFELSPHVVGRFDALYDRAAIVALPHRKRLVYASVLSQLMKDNAQGMMLTFDYPQRERNGPPFSVTYRDVQDYFEPIWSTELLDRIDLTPDNRWQLSRLEEPVIQLVRE